MKTHRVESCITVAILSVIVLGGYSILLYYLCPMNLCHYTFSTYCKVASGSMSRLVAQPSIFRLFMKGKFDAVTFGKKGPKLNSSPL